jgi:predicted DNA-binding transcriptional regulator AlpA
MVAAKVLTAVDVARVLGTSVQAIRNSLSRGLEGQTVPPSIRIGRRRLWLKSTVHAWLRAKARANPAASAVHPATPEKEFAMSRVKLAVGDVVVDDGEELTVVEIDREEGEVVFEDQDGEEVVMDLRDVREGFRDGDLEKLDSADD